MFCIPSLDSNLQEWCDSINEFDIIPSHSDLAVSNSPCGTIYDPDRTATVGLEMAADTSRAPAGTSRETLYTLWKEHPIVRDNCCSQNNGQNTTIEYIEKLFNFEDNFYEYASGLAESVAIGLREELTTQCSIEYDQSFCSISNILPIIDKILQLPHDKTEWTDDIIAYKQAVLVNFVSLKKEHFPDLQINENDILIQATNTAINLVRDNSFNTLEQYISYLPENIDNTLEICDSDHLCLLGKIVKEINTLLIEQTENEERDGKKRLIVNGDVNSYQEMLEGLENNIVMVLLSNKHSTLMDVVDELKAHEMYEFNNIQSHLNKMKTFDYKLGQANLEYIINKINIFKDEAETIVPKMEDDINTLIESTLITAGTTIDNIDVGVLVTLFNPLLEVLGGERAFTEPLQSITTIISSISSNDELVNVSTALSELKNKAEEINDKFTIDSDLFKNISMIIQTTSRNDATENAMKEFVKNSKDFVPTVTEDEIMLISPYWDKVILASCTKNETTLKHICDSLPEVIKRYFEMAKVMYQLQYEIILRMSYFILQTIVSIDSTNTLSTEIAMVSRLDHGADSPQTDTTLSLIAGLSYITYKTRTLHAIESYCDILEYTGGGIRPVECKGIQTNIQLLLADNNPECTSETHSFFYNVPTRPAYDGDLAYVNIAQLYSGEWMPFKIPNSQWLVDNKWIQEHEKDYAIFVQQLELYLPIDIGDKVKIFHTLAESVTNNVIKPDETDYIITSNSHMVSEYQMGPARVPCQLNKRKFQNPYTYCGESDVSEICGLSLSTQQQQQQIQPSIYSYWILKVIGAKNLTIPNPATDLNLVFGIKLCKVKNDTRNTIDLGNFVKVQYAQSCCPEGQYRPNMEALCEDCPPNSYSVLSGYYCEKTCDTVFT